MTGLYIHWPYCRSKCPYCDFNSHVAQTIDEDAWIDGFAKAFALYDEYGQLNQNGGIDTLFFGGGTPSLMPIRVVETVLELTATLNGGHLPPEITLEANPTSVEQSAFRDLAGLGVNRLSLGIQALNDPDLKFLGREHSAAEALSALDLANQYFERVSFDLIYARPGQTEDHWRQELAQALAMEPGHLSLYQLTIEPQTKFHQQFRRGEFTIPGEELAANLYQMTEDMTTQAGLVSYEVSNYARPGLECRHNMIYWQGGDYIGIGPGAHGRLNLEAMDFQDVHLPSSWIATRQHRAPDIWLRRMCALNDHPPSFQSHIAHAEIGAEKREPISTKDRLAEMVMMGLRLRDGIDLQTIIPSESGFDKEAIVNIGAVETLRGQGYIAPAVLGEDRLKLTPQGRLVLNAILDYILL